MPAAVADNNPNCNNNNHILPGLSSTGVLTQQELLNALLQTAQGMSSVGSSMLGSMLGEVLPPSILAHLEKTAPGGDALANLIQGITAASAAEQPLPPSHLPLPFGFSSSVMMLPPGVGLAGYMQPQPHPPFGYLDTLQLGVSARSRERTEARGRGGGGAFGGGVDGAYSAALRHPISKPKKVVFKREDLPEDNAYEEYVKKLPPVVRERRVYRHEAFPDKLYRMLEECEERGMNHAICFTEAGTAFRIVNTRIFERQVLPHYFRHNKYSSFR